MRPGLLLTALGAAGMAASISLLARGDAWMGLFFYPAAWWSYLLLIDGLNRWSGGASLLVDRAGMCLRMALFSVPAWLYYEAVNLRIRNWEYWQVPGPTPLRWAGYTLAFATVLPAVLETADLVERALGDRGSRPAPSLADGTHDRLYLVFGLACLVLPLAWPKVCFPLVWGAVFFLLEPWLARNRPERSLLKSFADGKRREAYALLASGLVCGLLWESLNYWAGAKWKYTVPWPRGPKLFEMPLLGYLGFPPFALCCSSVWNFFEDRWEAAGPAGRAAAVCALAALSLLVFRAMDLHTVRSTVPLPL